MASDIASFLLWYLQGNEAQLASPANVILIYQNLLEFCQLEGVLVQAGDVLSSWRFSSPQFVGSPFMRMFSTDQCDFIGSTLQKLDPQLC